MAPFSCISCLFLSLAVATWAQTIHTVTVGAQGSFYEPATVSVALNDTVRFIFVGPLHGVIQCAFDNPCFPLPGGFSSGFAGVGNNPDAPPPVWDLLITNVSHPIWFYCANTKPVSHCESGMVGAINPPSIEQYNVFRSAAQRVTVTPSVGPPVVTSAPDAFATNSPLPTVTVSKPASINPTSEPPITPTPSPTPPGPTETVPTSTGSAAPATATSHKPAIIGGSVGGGIVFMILVLFTVLLVCRRRVRRAKERPASHDFFRYHAHTPDLSSGSDGGSGGMYAPVKVTSPTFGQAEMQMSPDASLIATMPLAPVRMPHRNNSVTTGPPRAPRPLPAMASTTTFATTTAPPPTVTGSGGGGGGGGGEPGLGVSEYGPQYQNIPGDRNSGQPNIQALAREVAAVLQQKQRSSPPTLMKKMERPGSTEASQQQRQHVYSQQSLQSFQNVGGAESPAPPRYWPS